MNKDTLHLMMVPFTGLGEFGGYRSDSWFKHRIIIFKQFTLNGLLKQTDQNFTLWCSFRPEERENPICQELYTYLKEVCTFPVVFTYGGLPFWDDKFPNDNLFERLKIMLPQLKETVGDYKWILETIQPSDDTYHKDFVKEVNKQEPAYKRSFLHSNGYVYDMINKRLAEWRPITNPPFYTIVYPRDVFLDPVKRFKYCKEYRSHESAATAFKSVKLADGQYCVGVHKGNISTSWWHPFRCKEIKGKKAQKILKGFGIEC